MTPFRLFEYMMAVGLGLTAILFCVGVGVGFLGWLLAYAKRPPAPRPTA